MLSGYILINVYYILWLKLSINTQVDVVPSCFVSIQLTNTIKYFINQNNPFYSAIFIFE